MPEVYHTYTRRPEACPGFHPKVNLSSQTGQRSQPKFTLGWVCQANYFSQKYMKGMGNAVTSTKRAKGTHIPDNACNKSKLFGL